MKKMKLKKFTLLLSGLFIGCFNISQSADSLNYIDIVYFANAPYMQYTLTSAASVVFNSPVQTEEFPQGRTEALRFNYFTLDLTHQTLQVSASWPMKLINML